MYSSSHPCERTGGGKMILVAITGNICSGKSFLLKIIERLGYKIFSCDDEVKNILEEKIILEKIKKIFPEAFEKKKLNKKKLAEIIFGDELARKKLEEILYPKLFSREEKFISESKKNKNKNKIIFFEVPLLYEKKLEGKYNFVITMCAPKNILLKRADEKKIDQEKFFNILKTQLPSEEKEKRADYCINSDVSSTELEKKIKKIIEEVLK